MDTVKQHEQTTLELRAAKQTILDLSAQVSRLRLALELARELVEVAVHS